MSTLPRLIGVVGIFERLRHPVVHAEVEVAHHEHRRLQLLGEIEGLTGHGEALAHADGISIGWWVSPCESEAVEADVALRGARRQAGGRPHALDVQDDAGNFDVVAKADELGHQRNARAGGGGHGARARPSRAQRHADGGEFVFRLNDSEGRLAVGVDAVAPSCNRSATRPATTTA